MAELLSANFAGDHVQICHEINYEVGLYSTINFPIQVIVGARGQEAETIVNNPQELVGSFDTRYGIDLVGNLGGRGLSQIALFRAQSRGVDNLALVLEQSGNRNGFHVDECTFAITF